MVRDKHIRACPPVARGTCPQWLGFARQNRGCGCIRLEIGHCENAPIIPSHTPHNILGQYDGRMSKPTADSVLSMRHIRRKCYTEDKEDLSTWVHIRCVNQAPTRPPFIQSSFKSEVLCYMDTWKLGYKPQPQSTNAIIL